MSANPRVVTAVIELAWSGGGFRMVPGQLVDAVPASPTKPRSG